MYYSAWFADTIGLPVTTGLPIVGTFNDGSSKHCGQSGTGGGALFVMQLAEFDWSSPLASRMYEVNCMTDYRLDSDSGGTNSPNGWYGHCTSGDNPGAIGRPCGWKSRGIFVRGGNLYLFVERQYSPGTQTIHDATMVVSADKGATWKNPHTVFTGGPSAANGDPPKCDAASSSPSDACTNVGYLDTAHSGAHSSIMWKALPDALYNWATIEYGQDWGGASPSITMPTDIRDGCNPLVYSCFISGYEGTLARVLNSDLPSLDVSKWRYYTCPTLTNGSPCPSSDSSNWTATFGDRTPVLPVWSWSHIYIKEFTSRSSKLT
jgi:hypothetical protein